MGLVAPVGGAPPEPNWPSQLTVLPDTAAVPLVAVAETTLSSAGNVCANSCPGLSNCVAAPELEIVIVKVTVLPTRKLPLAVSVALSSAGERTTNEVGPPVGDWVSAVASLVPLPSAS